MIKIAICDDEHTFIKKLRQICIEYFDRKGVEYEIKGFRSGKTLCQYFLKHEAEVFDIVFLDINMEDMDGIKAAEQIRKNNSQICIVFITAFISYSLEGYKVNALRYILKSTNNFELAVIESLDACMERIAYLVDYRTFAFCEGEKRILMSDVEYVESNLHKLTVHFKNSDTTYSLYGKLNELEKEWNLFYFVRIHQSYYVNLNEISEYKRYAAFLKSGKEVPIPKSKYKEIVQKIITYKGSF